jgi:hypothetical protein
LDETIWLRKRHGDRRSGQREPTPAGQRIRHGARRSSTQTKREARE